MKELRPIVPVLSPTNWLIGYYIMIVWILAGNCINLSIAMAIIR